MKARLKKLPGNTNMSGTSCIERYREKLQKLCQILCCSPKLEDILENQDIDLPVPKVGGEKVLSDTSSDLSDNSSDSDDNVNIESEPSHTKNLRRTPRVRLMEQVVIRDESSEEFHVIDEKNVL